MLNKPDFASMRQEILAYDEQRELLIKKSRDVLKLSKQVIYAVHRDELKQAEKLIEDIKKEKSAPVLHRPFDLYLFLDNLVNYPFYMHLNPCYSPLHKDKYSQRINNSGQSAYDNSKSNLLNAKNHLLTSIFNFMSYLFGHLYSLLFDDSFLICPATHKSCLP